MRVTTGYQDGLSSSIKKVFFHFSLMFSRDPAACARGARPVSHLVQGVVTDSTRRRSSRGDAHLTDTGDERKADKHKRRQRDL